jgi:hypothetical protein
LYFSSISKNFYVFWKFIQFSKIFKQKSILKKDKDMNRSGPIPAHGLAALAWRKGQNGLAGP